MAEVFANPLAELAEYTDMKQDMDIRGIITYAKAWGKHVIDLSDEEKAHFIRNKE